MGKKGQHFEFFLSASVLIANTTAAHDVQEERRQNFWPADGASWDIHLRSVGPAESEAETLKNVVNALKKTTPKCILREQQ